MKIVRRGFGEKFALLELEDGGYFHLPLESLYIPHVGQTFEVFARTIHATRYAVWVTRPNCGTYHGMYEYQAQEDPHELKEIV